MTSTPAARHLMRLLAVEGVTGHERAVAGAVHLALAEAGVPASAMHFDDANARIPLPTETGNLIVKLPGRGIKASESPLLFMTHLDTVPLCAGARPRLDGRRIVNDASTALGGDNRTGCAVLVNLVERLAESGADHPPLTLLFTVREESGLFGARYLDPTALGPVKFGFNFDGKRSTDVILGAVGADRWEVEVHGRASHAGVHPDLGVSATAIFALALADIVRGGWFGQVQKGAKLGTSNVGTVCGKDGAPAGDATNVVTDYLYCKGESRSHDPAFVSEITAAYKAAFESAAAQVRTSTGDAGRVNFTVRPDYPPFRLADDSEVVARASAAIRAELGTEPVLKITNGGLDANWLVTHGIPVASFGAGQNEIHTVNEWIDLDEFDRACRLAVRLATM